VGVAKSDAIGENSAHERGFPKIWKGKARENPENWLKLPIGLDGRRPRLFNTRFQPNAQVAQSVEQRTENTPN